MNFHIDKWQHGYRPWFAWFPVQVNPYEGDWVWLEWVEREPDGYGGGITGYQYRRKLT